MANMFIFFRIILLLCHDQEYSQHEHVITWAYASIISFVHNICEYIPMYSLACPWLFTWPDLEEDEPVEEDYASEPDA